MYRERIEFDEVLLLLVHGDLLPINLHLEYVDLIDVELRALVLLVGVFLVDLLQDQYLGVQLMLFFIGLLQGLLHALVVLPNLSNNRMQGRVSISYKTADYLFVDAQTLLEVPHLVTEGLVVSIQKLKFALLFHYYIQNIIIQ